MPRGKPRYPFQPDAHARTSPDPAALFSRAVECHQRGQLAMAESLYREALKLNPRLAEVLQNLGLLLVQRGDPRGALAPLRKAVKIDARSGRAHFNLGVAQQQLGRLQEALASFTRSVALQPDLAEAHCGRGTVLGKLGRFDQALASYEQALALRPDYPEALDGRGNALTDLGRIDEALAAYDCALALRPDYVEALENRAYALTDLNRHDEALADHDRALALRPDFGRAHFDASMALLAIGQFARGWREFEWRFRVEGAEQDIRGFRQPQWRGEEPVSGETILLYAEQGIGDTIQFCRYAPMVAARGARVLLEVQKPITALLAQLPGVSQVIARGEEIPAFDRHCPLLSLPLAFGTELATIPAPPSYLCADADRRDRWRERLGAKSAPRIGLVWSGNPLHRNDRARSIPLETMSRLCRPGIDFVSLQKDVRTDDAAVLRTHPAIRNCGESLEDFSDTAGLIACLDLVVSVDTSVVHLAGALGKPVWVLLPFAPDWRWLLDREDSPWYPSARLFRQPRIGDWDTVLGRVAAELEQFS
jgi:Tfp pilus assembly protein PilF